MGVELKGVQTNLPLRTRESKTNFKSRLMTAMFILDERGVGRMLYFKFDQSNLGLESTLMGHSVTCAGQNERETAGVGEYYVKMGIKNTGNVLVYYSAGVIKHNTYINRKNPKMQQLISGISDTITILYLFPENSTVQKRG